MIDAILSTIKNKERRNELAKFYSKYKERFCCIANSKLKNHDDAEDAVQEVFSKIADKPEAFFGVLLIEKIAYSAYS